MNKVLKIYYIITLLLLLFVCNKGIALENKIIFKINNQAYTTIDYKNRLKYLNFIGDNINLEEKIIINDYISSILFYEYYRKTKPIKELDNIALQIFQNIKLENVKNKKILNFEIVEENIISNLKLDYIRKTIIEQILNSRLNEINNSVDEIDLLYNFTIEYINIKNNKINFIKDQIKSFKLNTIEEIELLLKQNKIIYFKKKQKLKNINNINDEIKNNIVNNNYFFILDNNNNNITYVKINKYFKTFDTLNVLLYSYRSQGEIEDYQLKCSNLKDNEADKNINSNKYEFNELNSKIKENLININDYVKFTDEGENIYIILCDIKYNLEALKEYSFNNSVNVFAKNIEKNFMEKYSKIFDLILYE